MLKSLFTRIKSEKASSTLQKEEEKPDDNSLKNIKPQIKNYQFKSLNKTSVMKNALPTIRYSVEPDAPNVYNQILACPLSSFNLLPYGKRKVKQIDLRNSPSPDYIKQLNNMLQEELPTYNNLLINVYPPGVGIMPHFDGPMYKAKVVVLSLGGPAIITFNQDYGKTNKKAALLLENQSIHIFEDQAYQKCLHGIEDFTVDSLYFKARKNTETGLVEFQNASINNFNESLLCQKLVEVFKNCKTQKIQEQVDLTHTYGTPCCLLPIKGNQNYNYVVELKRQERISITIREKYHEK